MAAATLMACGPVETDLWEAAAVAPPALDAHPWAAATPAADVAVLSHGEVMPTAWGRVVAPLVPAAPETTVAGVLAPMARRCHNSDGRFDFVYVACHCPAGTLYAASVGCAAVPLLQLTTAGCAAEAAVVPIHCLHDLQAGPIGWHLHYSGHKAWQATVRQALAPGAWPSLLARGTLLPTADSPISLHRTNRLAAGAATFVGQDSDAVVLWPAQYTEPWTALPEAPPIDWQRSFTALQALPQPDAAAAAGALAQAAAVLARASAAGSLAAAWPDADVRVRSAHAAATSTWPAGHLDVAERRLHISTYGGLPPCRWQVYLRDGAVVARQLSFALGGAPKARWEVAALIDALGNVQALRVALPDAAGARQLMLPQRALPPPVPRQPRSQSKSPRRRSRRAAPPAAPGDAPEQMRY